MRRSILFVSVLVLVGMMVSLGAASPTGTETVPGQVGVCVGAGCTLSEGQLGGGETASFSLPITRVGTFERNEALSFGEDSVNLGVSGNVDPVQTLAFAVADGGAASSFAVALSVPLVPTIIGPATFTLTLFGDCTDGAADGCSITPFLSAPGISEYFVNGFTTSLGTRGEARALPSPGDDFLGQPFGTIAGVFDCGLAGCTSFETLLSFTGSGGSDSFGFTSRFEINAAPIPEPSTISLLGLGVLSLGVALWRRRSSAM